MMAMLMQFEGDQSPGYRANWAARLFTRLADRRLNPLGLAAGQVPVFTALAMTGPASQKALALAAAIEQPTMAATLSRMERDGVIERRPDPSDGRSALVSLTSRTRGRVDPIFEALATINEESLKAMPKAEREIFLAGLRTMIAHLETSLADTG